MALTAFHVYTPVVVPHLTLSFFSQYSMCKASRLLPLYVFARWKSNRYILIGFVRLLDFWVRRGRLVRSEDGLPNLQGSSKDTAAREPGHLPHSTSLQTGGKALG
jgi:hypothetical protein